MYVDVVLDWVWLSSPWRISRSSHPKTIHWNWADLVSGKWEFEHQILDSKGWGTQSWRKKTAALQLCSSNTQTTGAFSWEPGHRRTGTSSLWRPITWDKPRQPLQLLWALGTSVDGKLFAPTKFGLPENHWEERIIIHNYSSPIQSIKLTFKQSSSLWQWCLHSLTFWKHPSEHPKVANWKSKLKNTERSERFWKGYWLTS